MALHVNIYAVSYVVGQCWLSESEPELGLGIVERVDPRRIRVAFTAANCRREYSIEVAPLRRVIFQVGDEVQDRHGRSFSVAEVVEQTLLVRYRDQEGHEIAEAELSPRMRFSRPEARLVAGHWDDTTSFELRRSTWSLLEELRSSEVRGLVGGRLSLLPHQLFIADQVSRRHRPRALLADEVGLGKTIEAGLILHRLLSVGRIARVLVLVPDALVHQWFFELYRRFHLSFRIVDQSFWDGVCDGDSEANPFEEVQTVISSLDFVTSTNPVTTKAMDAPWDMLVVDEAHHLLVDSPSYRIVETIARRAPGMLLLTATPEQLGIEHHFARLRLLDPHRYSSYQAFESQTENYRRLARVLDGIDDESLDQDFESLVDAQELDGAMGAAVSHQLADPDLSNREKRERLIDLFGPGRVLFRNTRRVMTEFPERVSQPTRLPWSSEAESAMDQYHRLAEEFVTDTRSEISPSEYRYDDDGRLEWLGAFARRIAPDKVLLICRYPAKAVAIRDTLRYRKIAAGLFHEGLPLLQRDRNAAWFADPEGTQVLLCSELGSEGRNFQFAQHLVLFDLPLNPELLEQRIGRLDRIGQRGKVWIHTPFYRSSAQEVSVRWYQDGLEAFERSLPAGAHFMSLAEQAYELGLETLESQDFTSLTRKGDNVRLDAFVSHSVERRREIETRVEQGRDRLLELSSFRADRGRELVDAIERWDTDPRLDRYFESLLEHFGVEFDELGERKFLLKQGNRQNLDSLPGIRGEEQVLVCDRQLAMSREDLGFLTWDHPVMSGLMDFLVGSDQGNSAVAVQRDADDEGFSLECVFIVSTVASPALQVDRFLPPTVHRVVVEDRGLQVAKSIAADRLEDGRRTLAGMPGDALKALVGPMLSRAREDAAKFAQLLRTRRLRTMNKALESERQRLEELSGMSGESFHAELNAIVDERNALAAVIADARETLDSLRLVWRQKG